MLILGLKGLSHVNDIRLKNGTYFLLIYVNRFSYISSIFGFLSLCLFNH